jgi:hypothetical protein
MTAGGISVARTLPIDGALLSDVLLRLRRDSPASVLRWTLGDLGCAEVDVAFVTAGSATAGHGAGITWTSTARLWNHSGLVVATAALTLAVLSVDEVRLTLDSDGEPGPVWGECGEELTAVAQAALDELGEELLWHATRAGIRA